MKRSSANAVTFVASTTFPVDGGWGSVLPNASVEVFYCWDAGPAHAGHPRWRPGDAPLGKPADATAISLLAVDEHGQASPFDGGPASRIVDPEQALNLTVVGAIPMSLRVAAGRPGRPGDIQGWQGFLGGTCRFSVSDGPESAVDGAVLIPGPIGPPTLDGLVHGRFLNLYAEATALMSIAPLLAR